MTPPSNDVLQQWPLLALAIAVIYVLRAALEVSGQVTKNLTGISKLLSPKARADAEIDERLADMKERVEILGGTVALLKGELVEARRIAAEAAAQAQTQSDEIRIAHRLTDAQGRAINEHLAWDRRLLARVREALPDFEFPDPPDMYVFLGETS